MENVLKTTKADEKALLEAESRYCSYGDTVHYLEPAKLFAGCNGSFLYDYEDKPYLDLQMWYSAVNFGYANPRLNDALKRQIDTLPQVASQYLHKEKIELAAMLCESIKDAWGEEGRVHFNVGGSQAIEDSLKLVRNACGGKSLMIAFEGGYHGRTLGASSITSSYRYRRRYGHFGERALFVPFPYCFRCPYGKRRDDCGMFCADQFERLFETEYYGVWDPKAGEAEYAAFYVECIQGTGGYVIPPDGYYPRLKTVLDERKIMLVDDEIDGLLPYRQALGPPELRHHPGRGGLRQGHDQRPEPPRRHLGQGTVYQSAGVPLRLHALDLCQQPPRHGGGPRNHADAGGRGLRSPRARDGRLLP